MDFFFMALYQHFCQASHSSKIAIDLKRGMGIE